MPAASVTASTIARVMTSAAALVASQKLSWNGTPQSPSQAAAKLSDHVGGLIHSFARDGGTGLRHR
jgi:hypothetical protein